MRRGLIILAVVGVTAHAHAEPPRADVSHVWFAEGGSYSGQIILADSAALASVPIVLAATLTGPHTTSYWGWSFLSMAAPSLTGPIVHLTHGRYVPALISFLGWASFAGTSAALGWIFGITEGVGCMCPTPSNELRGWVVGSAIAVTGAAVMTTVDAFFARAPRKQSSGSVVQPSVTPLERGMSLGLAGAW